VKWQHNLKKKRKARAFSR